MAGKSVVSLSAICDFFDDKNIIRRGENSVTSGFVEKVLFDDKLNVIRGTVHASMRQKLYNVEIYLSEGEIQKATCDCPKGLYFCHHMASLAIFAHKNLSVTDQVCQWSKIKTSDSDTTVTAEDCFGKPSQPFCPLLNEISEASVHKFTADLKACGPTGLGWLLSPEPAINEETPVSDVEQLLFSEEYANNENPKRFLGEKLMLTEEEIINAEQQTRGQSNNPTWYIVRKHRLTASNFGRILGACKRNRFPPSLFQTLSGNTNLDGIKQIQWGRSNESTALEKYEQRNNVKVTKSGIWLHKCGFLGASPDGIVDDNVIEVKCPFKYRDNVFSECLTNVNNYIVRFDGNKFIVNKDHDYYHQIQGQMHISGKKACILIIWSTKDYVEITIKKNEEWKTNLCILQDFYLNKYIQYILN